MIAIRQYLKHALLIGCVLALSAGLAARAFGFATIADGLWIGATSAVLMSLSFAIVKSLWKGEVGLDIVAALSMTGALILGETLAAIVVAMMYAGGRFLENYAEQRAQREMTALLARAPRTALRYGATGLETAPVDQLAPGERLLIRKGDVIPADGEVLSDLAVVDLSSITGEALPVRLTAGKSLQSGAINVSEVFDMRVSKPAAESTFAGIVRLVEAARASKAPMSRLADRFGLIFLAITVVMASAAYLLTGDPIRGLAVLVVATPCPLILAVPVAFVSGLSRAASLKILIKGGPALEALTRVGVLVIDKTGTLTLGGASLAKVKAAPGFSSDELLRIAASLDQASKNVVAQALVAESIRRRMSLASPRSVVETAGEGVEGLVGDQTVVLGSLPFVSSRLGLHLAQDADARNKLTVAIGIDGKYAGTFILADKLRADAKAFIADIKSAGIARVVLASGDHADSVAEIARDVGITAVESDLKPEDKVRIVLRERESGPVMMVGDGVNDAPALAAADVGVAMGAGGAAASAEAADVVLLTDELIRLAIAIKIAKRTKSIALQSVYAGMGLSFAGMIAAAFGYLTPVQGALFQEAIDVAVILNALRALTAPADEQQGQAVILTPVKA